MDGRTELPEHEEGFALLGLGGSHPLADYVVLVVQQTGGRQIRSGQQEGKVIERLS